MTAINTSTEAVERLALDHQTVGDNPVRFSMGHPHHWHTAAVLRQLLKERDEARALVAAAISRAEYHADRNTTAADVFRDISALAKTKGADHE